MVAEMAEIVRAEGILYPAFLQPRRGGISATVSAAVRIAKKRGLIVEGGKDGWGKRYYVAPVPPATHPAPGNIN
jgi:hypothetical protein